MSHLPLLWTASVSTTALTSQIYWVSWDVKKLDLLKNSTSNTRNILELLMPTLSKTSSYQFWRILLEGKSHKQSSRNNQSRWCLPHLLKYERNIFQKNLFKGDAGQNFFGQMFMSGIVLHEGTNDQIHASWWVGA